MTIDYCYRVGFVPETYKQAVSCVDSNDLSVAMDEEINALKRQQNI